MKNFDIFEILQNAPLGGVTLKKTTRDKGGGGGRRGMYKNDISPAKRKEGVGVREKGVFSIHAPASYTPITRVCETKANKGRND